MYTFARRCLNLFNTDDVLLINLFPIFVLTCFAYVLLMLQNRQKNVIQGSGNDDFCKMKRDLFFIFAFYITSVYGNITYKAKFIGNVKVSGNSDLVYALSVTQCLALCNKNSDCDAITYYDELNKCRLFKKCAPVQQLNMSAHYWFYAKRPPSKYM